MLQPIKDTYYITIPNPETYIDYSKSYTEIHNPKQKQFGSFIGIPFYYQKKGHVHDKSIHPILTITTMCNLALLHLAQRMTLNFNGPISIAIYFETNEEIKNASIIFSEYFDFINNPYDINIGVLYPNYSSLYYQSLHFNKNTRFSDKFPQNALRNLAAFQVDTEYILTIDVDFIYISNTINSVNTNPINFINEWNKLKTIWIVPSFEFTSIEYENQTDMNDVQNKLELIQMVKNNKIIPFHFNVWKHAQKCTKYSKWYKTKNNYIVNYCDSRYEPWVIVKTYYEQNEYGWNNEYIGRGCNKVERIARFMNDCFTLEVVHDMFMIHPFSKHKSSSKWQQVMIKKSINELKWYCADGSNTCISEKVCGNVKMRIKNYGLDH